VGLERLVADLRYFDSLSGLIFFLLLGKFLQEKTYAAFSFERSIEDFLPISVFSEDRGEYIRLAALVEGERINIPTGTVVPVLSEAVMEGSLDYSFVTGESIPQKIKEGSTVYPGATNVGGTLVALVMDSPKSAQIEGLWKEDVTETTGWVEERTTAIFTITVLILALAGGILWYFEVPERALEIAVSVLIIACPCALSLAAPFAYGTASGVLAKSGLFLKSAIGIETLAAVRKVYWDKTGTLTHQPKSEQLSFLTEQQMQAVKAIVARSTHPIAQSILSQLAEVQPATLMHWQEHVGLGLEGVGEDGKLYKIGSGKWLGLPEGPTYFLEDNLHLGSYEPNWGYRQITQMLLELRNRGLQNHLISGDSPRELPVEWKEVFMERVHFNCTPIQKSSLIDPKEASLYIGDGLNDVEAMASATIGLSIVDGELGYFPKSDGVIDAKLLHKLPFMLSYSKRMVRLVHNAYFFSLLYNLLGVAFALLGWLTPVIAAILMPLSSISVVLFSVIGARMMAAKS
jgi:Cu+-exporting ATPase